MKAGDVRHGEREGGSYFPPSLPALRSPLSGLLHPSSFILHTFLLQPSHLPPRRIPYSGLPRAVSVRRGGLRLKFQVSALRFTLPSIIQNSSFNIKHRGLRPSRPLSALRFPPSPFILPTSYFILPPLPLRSPLSHLLPRHAVATECEGGSASPLLRRSAFRLCPFDGTMY